MFTHNGLINLVASGRYKRSEYEFNGSILNQILFPIVIKDVNLKIADMDIARVINSMNNQPTAQVQSEVKAETIASATEDVSEIEDENNDEANDAVTFNAGILIVERCIFNLVKGNYNDVQISDLKANLTLDKNGILEVKSNRFNIAEGISSLKVRCDLKKHLYSLVLGVKDVNSDVLATAILNLKREISGKASGIISINTDDSLKLNGFIKFSVKDGTIGKVGLIEYVLKFASLFRNPLASISPSTITDLVNIPEGNFDKITGDIVMKDNVIEKIDNAITRKLEKSKNYERYPNNGLYIFSHCHNLPRKMLKDYFYHQPLDHLFYQHIYINCVNHLYHYNVQAKTLTNYKYHVSELAAMNKIALEFEKHCKKTRRKIIL